MKTLRLSMIAIVAIVTGLMSCGKEEVPAPPPNPSISITDSIEVPFSSTAPYILFSFKNGAIVSNNDSASTDWDFGMRFVNFIVNSHASGPGNAAVITQSGLYDSCKLAPQSGFAYDTTATQLAINSNWPEPGSWFEYDLTTHIPYSKAGQFFIFRTADNHYAKMEVVSIGYLQFTGLVPVTLVYKFKYTYQADGSRDF